MQQWLLLVLTVVVYCALSIDAIRTFNQLIPAKVSYMLATINTAILLAAPVDCKIDCLRNCSRVAPGNAEYCKGSCGDYCDQPDR